MIIYSSVSVLADGSSMARCRCVYFSSLVMSFWPPLASRFEVEMLLLFLPCLIPHEIGSCKLQNAWCNVSFDSIKVAKL